VQWKYGGAAMTLILEDVGVLVQTLYLVATAMRLAPCALGATDPELFAQATNIDRLEEPQVGAFWLGSTDE
jgi:SagB-type dehydrogenase family enzyme